MFNAGRSGVPLTTEFQLIRATFGWLGRNNIPVYTGALPGAYIPQMEKLRKREVELDQFEENLRRQRSEIRRLRDELLGKS